jgi:hypothetical protein
LGGLVIAAAGAAAGLAGSMAVSRGVQSQRFDVRPGDIVAGRRGRLFGRRAATLPAARRAARTDPLIALRAE